MPQNPLLPLLHHWDSQRHGGIKCCKTASFNRNIIDAVVCCLNNNTPALILYIFSFFIFCYIYFDFSFQWTKLRAERQQCHPQPWANKGSPLTMLVLGMMHTRMSAQVTQTAQPTETDNSQLIKILEPQVQLLLQTSTLCGQDGAECGSKRLHPSSVINT